MNSRPIIGVDFDGTVATYDRLFHRCAVEKFGLPGDVPANKHAIRSFFWLSNEGRQQWIELQGIVYGSRMDEADMAPGLDGFLAMCRERHYDLFVISHKTEYPVAGPRVNLRETAFRWLKSKGFFDKTIFAISQGRVFFESSRAEKIRRIITCGCTHFIDDLPEVFLEPSFPIGVKKLLYAPGDSVEQVPGARRFAGWDEIRNYITS